MKKLLIITAAVLLVVIVGVGVYLYNSIDPIVKAAIEKYGSEITGTKVSVGSVDISLESGRGTIRGIEVHNPKGFSSAAAFRLGEITIDLDVASLNKDPVVIDEVTIAEPEVYVELAENGQTNIGVLKDHVDGFHAGSTASRKQEAGYEKKFRITKLVFEEGRVEADAEAVGAGAIEEDLPPVRMRDVGGAQGSSPDVIGKEVTHALLGAAMSVITKEIGRRAAGKLEGNAKKALEQILK
jgi:uncharacterized protein involved in outer membrane biogenesis